MDLIYSIKHRKKRIESGFRSVWTYVKTLVQHHKNFHFLVFPFVFSCFIQASFTSPAHIYTQPDRYQHSDCMLLEKHSVFLPPFMIWITMVSRLSTCLSYGLIREHSHTEFCGSNHGIVKCLAFQKADPASTRPSVIIPCVPYASPRQKTQARGPWSQVTVYLCGYAII